MTGLEMLLVAGGEKGYTFSEPGKHPEGISLIDVTKESKTITVNMHTLSGIYGALTFFHFAPEDAIEELFIVLDSMYLEEKNISDEEKNS